MSSWGHYTTASNGSSDLSRDVSRSGTHKGLQPMGLFWSMLTEFGQRKGTRLFKGDITSPCSITLTVVDDHVAMDTLTSSPSEYLCHDKVYRWYKHPDVKRKEIVTGSIRATMFVPPVFRICYTAIYMDLKRTITAFHVNPKKGLIDEDVHLRVSGLAGGQPVTVMSQLVENKNRFAAFAHYIADHNGEVNLKTASSIGGFYTGIEPMGLFWSMQQEDGQRKGIRLVKKDVSQPYDVRFSVLDGLLSWENLNHKPHHVDRLCTEHCYRWYQHMHVSRIDVTEGKIRGALFIPKGGVPRPGVIDFFGTAGGLIDFRAALLASRGFTTLSLAFFDYLDLPDTLHDVEFSYFEAAVDWFSSRPEVQNGGVGVLGVSKGGEIAMLMGIHCPKVKAVVSIGGPPHLTFTDLKVRDTVLEGIPLDESRVIYEDGVMITRHAFPYEDRHLFPFDQMKAQCLLIQGEDDQVYDPIHQQRIIADLDPEHRSKFKIACYHGAGHLIEPPHAPVCLKSWHKGVGRMCVWGGERKAHAGAQVQAWQTLLNFLRENLPTVSKL